ncbi:MAG: DUF2726 domain-containing protein [Pirellulaceae bacterium]
MSREDDFVTRIGRAARRFFQFGENENASSGEELANESSLKLKLRPEVLSPTQAKLYRSLVAAISADAVVFAKVRLSNFLIVSAGGGGLELGLKMDRKCVDFLLCDPFTMKPLAVVELVEPVKSPTQQASQPKDLFITRVLHNARIKHLRIEARSHYPIEELRKILFSKIGLVQLSESVSVQPPTEKKACAIGRTPQKAASPQRITGNNDRLGHGETFTSPPTIISRRIATA